MELLNLSAVRAAEVKIRRSFKKVHSALDILALSQEIRKNIDVQLDEEQKIRITAVLQEGLKPKES